MGSTQSIFSSQRITPDWLMTEANRLIGILTTLLSKTLELTVSYLDALEDRANMQATVVESDIKEYLDEFLSRGAVAKACIAERQSDIDAVYEKMKSSLLECYKKHTKNLNELSDERTALHEEALELKGEAEEIVRGCVNSDDNMLRCFTTKIYDVAEKVKVLMLRIEAHYKREFDMRKKSVLRLLNCDRKAIKIAYDASFLIIEDIEKCIHETAPKPHFQTSEEETPNTSQSQEI